MILYHFTSPQLWASADWRGFVRATPERSIGIQDELLPAPAVVWLTDQSAARRPRAFTLRYRARELRELLFEEAWQKAYAARKDATMVRLKVELPDQALLPWHEFASRHQLDRRWTRRYQRSRPGRGFDPTQWRVHEGDLPTTSVSEVGTKVVPANLIADLREHILSSDGPPLDTLLRRAKRAWLRASHDRYFTDPYASLPGAVWCVHDLDQHVEAPELLDTYFRNLSYREIRGLYEPWLEKLGPRGMASWEWRRYWAGEWPSLGKEHRFGHTLFLCEQDAHQECARCNLQATTAIVRLTPEHLKDAIIRNVGDGNPLAQTPPGHL